MNNIDFIDNLSADSKVIEENVYKKIFRFLEISSQSNFDRGLLNKLDDIYQSQVRLALELNSTQAAKNLCKHLGAVTVHEFFDKHFPSPAFDTFFWRWRGYVELVELLTWELDKLPKHWLRIKERQIGLEKYVEEFGKKLYGLIKNQSLRNWLEENLVVENLLKNNKAEIIVDQLSEGGQRFFLRQDDLNNFWKDQVDIKTFSLGDKLKIVFTI